MSLGRLSEEHHWHPCWVLDDDDLPAKWHIHLWRDIDMRRARTFLLPHTSVETGVYNILTNGVIKIIGEHGNREITHKRGCT